MGLWRRRLVAAIEAAFGVADSELAEVRAELAAVREALTAVVSEIMALELAWGVDPGRVEAFGVRASAGYSVLGVIGEAEDILRRGES